MILLENPDEYFGAFNPVIFKFFQQGEETCKIDLYIRNEFIQTFERDWLNEYAIFNLSNFLKRYFEDKIIYYNLPQRRIIGNRNFAFQVLIKNNFDNSTLYEGWAINAVSNFEGVYNMNSETDKFLTDFKVLKKYTDYPLDVSLIPKNSNTLFINDYSYDLTDFKKPVILNIWNDDNNAFLKLMQITYSELQANNEEQIITNTGEEILVISYIEKFDDIKVSDSCEYGVSKYVRWQNTRGGFNYWMFDRSQTIKKEITTETPIKKLSDVYKTNIGVKPCSKFGEILGARATNKIIVGSENLTRDEITGLETILLSPKIEIYDKIEAIWIPAYIEKGKSEIKTDETRFSFEVELTLAPIKLQY